MATICVIDDDPSILGLLRTTLGVEGHTVLTAEGGQEGLDLVVEELPDLVILDWMMPEVDGPQVIEAMRADPRTASVPIVMLTARQDAEQEALTLGADAYVTKPFNPLMLESVIEVMLAYPGDRDASAAVDPAPR